MAVVRIPVPDDKWDVIARIAALEGMGLAAWVEDFVAQQVRIVLETARQELDMNEGEFSSYIEGLDAGKKERQQAILDDFVAGIMATYDFAGLLAMHERTLS